MRKLKDSIVLHQTEHNQVHSYVLQQGTKYYELSPETFYILSLIQQGMDEADIFQEIRKKNAAIEESEIEALINYLDSERLFEGQQEPQKKRMSDMWGKKTLLTPEQMGKLPSCKFFFQKPVMIAVFLFMAFWLAEVLNKEYFFKTVGYIYEFSVGNYILVFLVIVGLSLAHETGHIMALLYHGYSPGEFGCGFYLTFPSFYVDVSKANLLPSSKRILVDIGGIYFQVMAILLLITANLWLQSKSVAFSCYLSTLMAIANLLPFTKSDGYFIFCDMLGSNDPFHDAISIMKNRKPIRHLTKNQLAVLLLSLFYALCMVALVVSCLLRLPASFKYLSRAIWILKANPIQSVDRNLTNIMPFMLNVLPSFVIILFVRNIVMPVLKEATLVKKKDDSLRV